MKKEKEQVEIKFLFFLPLKKLKFVSPFVGIFAFFIYEIWYVGLGDKGSVEIYYENIYTEILDTILMFSSLSICIAPFILNKNSYVKKTYALLILMPLVVQIIRCVLIVAVSIPRIVNNEELISNLISIFIILIAFICAYITLQIFLLLIINKTENKHGKT